RLLGARRQRPSRSAAEQRDEVAPFHVGHGASPSGVTAGTGKGGPVYVIPAPNNGAAPCRERPSGYSAAEKCDKVPPPHGAYPKAKDHGRSIAGVGVGQWRASQQKSTSPIRAGRGTLFQADMAHHSP